MTIIRQAQFTGENRTITPLTYFANAPTIGTTQAKTGTYSYPRYTNKGPIGKKLVTPSTQIRLGLWMYLANLTFQNTTLLYYAGHGLTYSGSANLIAMELHSDTGEINLVRNDGSGSTGTEELETISLPAEFGVTGNWFHIGITHKVDASDGFVSLYINGVRVMNYLGDTRPAHRESSVQTFQTSVSNVLAAGAGGTGGLQGFAGTTEAGAGCFIDDFYVDTCEGEDDAIVPSRRFLASLPTGAGENAEWTGISGANYANVDDNPNNGETDYNKALTAGLKDTFAFSDITLPVDHQIVAVIPTAFARRLDSELAHKLKVHAFDGLQYAESAELDLPMSFDSPVFGRLTLQPDGSPWNEADFNAMEFGYESAGTF